MTVYAEAAMRAACYPELHLGNLGRFEVDEALRRHFRRHRIRPKRGRSRVKGACRKNLYPQDRFLFAIHDRLKSYTGR
jgi:hypothetical protein